ncbi:MAG: ATP-binding cassette domain-containing protein [Thermoleophilia bacterium]|nr:ATP-binding cassette domain-containing protein [Thermoleophilia bacterium]
MSAEPPLVRLADFAVHHRRGPQAAVRDVDLLVEAGESMLVIGGEASGKTSLLRGILGLAPHSGDALVLGSAPGGATADGRIGFSPQGRPFPGELRVEELVRLIQRLRGIQRPGAVTETLHLCGLADHGARRLAQLDLEHARRASLACAAVGEPQLLLLDDPWESPETLAVLDAARDRGAGAILATAVPGGFPRFVDATLELSDGAPA